MALVRTGALLLASLLWAACGDDPEPAAGVSTGNGPDAPVSDAGSADAAPRVVRPDGGPVLPHADSEVPLAYGGDPMAHLITVDADLGALDVHLSIDTSQSIAGEIDVLQSALQGRIVSGIAARVPDVAFGVSRFEDFPAAPFGFPGDDRRRPDTPFTLLSPITIDSGAVANAVAALDEPLGFGGDLPEAGAEALWQIARGDGYSVGSREIIAPFDAPAVGGGTRGGVGFRQGALPVVLHVTDARSHEPLEYGDDFPDTHTLEEASQALRELGARVVGIVSQTCDEEDACEVAVETAARQQLELVADATMAVTEPDASGQCPHGIDAAPRPPFRERCPYVFDIAGDGSGLADTLVDAIVSLVDGVRFGAITARVSDDPLGFVQRVVPVLVEQPSGGAMPETADLLPEGAPDGELDSFVQVRARARLGFEVYLQNRRVAPMDFEQRFRVVIKILGDELIVDERTLSIIVPAGRAPSAPLTSDAGRPDGDVEADDDAG